MTGESGYRPEKDSRETGYLYWLSGIQGVGRQTLQILVGYFGSAGAVRRASREELQKVPGIPAACIERIMCAETRDEAERSFGRLREKQIEYYSVFSRQYPDRLRQLYDPPKHLYVRGKLPDPSRPSVGIVGARECTIYGKDIARMFGYCLAEAGIQVVSGMAKGIDGWAHQGALESGGDTYAVLGCGVDICYPAVHRRLYESIGRRGGVLSELPVGMEARAGFFPMRNRIISGLSDGILIVEAKERSGSLITADAALEQGKDVFAVPGRIGDRLSVGCNRLIRQGAIPVLAPSDILEYYGIRDEAGERKDFQSWETEILHILTEQPVSLAELEHRTGHSQTELMKCLYKWKKQGKDPGDIPWDFHCVDSVFNKNFRIIKKN